MSSKIKGTEGATHTVKSLQLWDKPRQWYNDMRVFVCRHTPASQKLGLFWSRTLHGYGPCVVIKSMGNKVSLIRLLHVQTGFEPASAEFNIRHWAFSLYSFQRDDCLNKRDKYWREGNTKSPRKKTTRSFIVEVHYGNSCSWLLMGP